MNYEILIVAGFILTAIVYWLLMVGMMEAIDWIYKLLFQWST